MSTPPGVTSSQFHPKSPLRYERLFFTVDALVAAVTKKSPKIMAGAGKVRDIIVGQPLPGGGTNWTPTINKYPVGGGAAVSICSTDAIVTAAGGTKTLNTALAPHGALTAVTGWTRPVVATDGKATFARGDALALDVAVTGDYSAGNVASIVVEVLVEYDF